MNSKNLRSSYNLKKLKRMEPGSLKEFAEIVRSDMIDIVSKTGGHIGVNLGVLEITIALHYTFDFLHDSLIFDTGHNCYVHKMLTGRLTKMKTMRHHGGLSGFPNPSESTYDLVSWSHAGDSLSVGAGIAYANNSLRRDNKTVVLIGDAALVEGASQEALNFIGGQKDENLLIVLNDNSIAIDPWDGGLFRYLKKIKGGAPETYFNSLGIDYVGPVDGHDVSMLVKTFKKLQHIKRPIIVHCVTRKGNGLKWRKSDPNKNHWLFPFDKASGDIIENGTDYWMKPSEPFLNSVAGDAIYKIVQDNKDSILISPATNGISGIVKVFQDFPKQSIDVAMAEQHSIAFAVGTTLKSNKKPIVCFQSAFLPRAFDQIIQDFALNEVPVLIVSTRSGIGGLDHDVHHALFDISYLSAIPNLKILFPGTQKQLEEAINTSYQNLDAPTIILYPYGTLSALNITKSDIEFDKKVSKGAKIAIVTTGNMYKYGYGLQKYLYEKTELKSIVKNIIKLSPIDSKKLALICKNYPFIVSLEENVLRGGFGSIISEYIMDNSYGNKLLRFGIPNRFLEKGLRFYLYPKCGMDYKSIYGKIKAKWGNLLNK